MNIIGLHGNTRYESKTPWYVVNNKESIGLSIYQKLFIWLSFGLFVWHGGIDISCKRITWYQCINVSLNFYDEWKVFDWVFLWTIWIYFMIISCKTISMRICFAVLVDPIVFSVTIHHDQWMVFVVLQVYEQAFKHMFHQG